jgi:sulfur-oxidizing protein SoxX
MQNKSRIAGLLLAMFAGQAAADTNADALTMMRADFKARGMATADRLVPDELQTLCNQTGNAPPANKAAAMEAAQIAGVTIPAALMGDWRAGEKLAQSGKGQSWSDRAGEPGGGSCYNCHQIGPKETSFGTIGPSLFQFGKIRGNSPEIQKYTYSKIWNAKATNLCSSMPRFGHAGALTADQIKDLVALLLDPESPVNTGSTSY